MKRIKNHFNKKNHFFKNITSRFVIFLIILTLGVFVVLPAIGCSKLNIEIFGLKIGESDKEENSESPIQDKNDIEIIEEPVNKDYENSYDAPPNNTTQDIQNDSNKNKSILLMLCWFSNAFFFFSL